MAFLLSGADADRRGVQGGHPPHPLPAGTRRREHGRRLQPRQQRQEDWRLHDADRSRRRKRLRWRGPGLRGLRTLPHYTRRQPRPAPGRSPQLRVRAQLPGHHQVGRPHQHGRAHPGDDEPRLHPPQARPARPRHAGASARRRPRRVPKRNAGLHTRPAVQVRRVPGGRPGPRRRHARGQVPHHQRRPGRALRRGHARAGRVRRTDQHPRHDHSRR